MNKFNIKVDIPVFSYDMNDCEKTIPCELKDIVLNHKKEYYEVLTDVPIDFADILDGGYVFSNNIYDVTEEYLYKKHNHINKVVDMNVIQGSTAPFQVNSNVYKHCYLIPKIYYNKSHFSNTQGDNKMNGIDLGQIISLKMLSSISNNEEFDIGKLMMIQSITGGKSVQISDIMKAKLCSALLKDDQKVEDLPIEKLMLYNMFDSGNIDVNSIIQMKFASKLL